MQGSKQQFMHSQRGISLSGLIFVLAVLGVLAVFGMKVLPTFIEYRAIKNGIASAKSSGGGLLEMRQTFDKNADINSVDAITGRDLIFNKDGGETDISFAYEKRIPLVANVSLLIEYAGTTARNGVVMRKPDTAAQ
jgi:hypothetical protein